MPDRNPTIVIHFINYNLPRLHTGHRFICLSENLNNSHPNDNYIAHLHTAPEVLEVSFGCRNPGVDLLGVSPDDVLVRDYYIVKR